LHNGHILMSIDLTLNTLTCDLLCWLTQNRKLYVIHIPFEV